jgi:hypothetical protein
MKKHVGSSPIVCYFSVTLFSECFYGCDECFSNADLRNHGVGSVKRIQIVVRLSHDE